MPYRRQFGASKVPRGGGVHVPILRMFGAITVPNVLSRFGAKKVDMGCGVPVARFFFRAVKAVGRKTKNPR